LFQNATACIGTAGKESGTTLPSGPAPAAFGVCADDDLIQGPRSQDIPVLRPIPCPAAFFARNKVSHGKRDAASTIAGRPVSWRKLLRFQRLASLVASAPCIHSFQGNPRLTPSGNPYPFPMHFPDILSFRLLLAVTTAWLPPCAAAATFTPESAATYARQHNPELAVARASIPELRARASHAGLGGGAPEIEAELRPNLAGREFAISAGVAWHFPLTKRLLLEREISLAAVTLAETEILTVERGISTEVKTAAIQLLALQSRRDLITKQTAAGRELAAALTKSAASGETSPLEAAQLELEISQLAIQTLQANTETAALTGALRPRLGCPASEPIQITGTLPTPRDPGKIPANLLQHPAYQAALTKAATARRNIDLADANRWEDLTVGVGLERSHQDDAGAGIERDNLAVLRFSFPLPIKKHAAGLIAEAEAAAARTTVEADATAARLRAGTAAALGEMKAHAAIHNETVDRLIPQATELENRFIQFQKTGQAALTDVLRARQQRLALQSAALDATRDFHLARLRYEAAAGL
jgi:outer membrane protein, heavy metal efflux system